MWKSHNRQTRNVIWKSSARRSNMQFSHRIEHTAAIVFDSNFGSFFVAAAAPFLFVCLILTTAVFLDCAYYTVTLSKPPHSTHIYTEQRRLYRFGGVDRIYVYFVCIWNSHHPSPVCLLLRFEHIQSELTHSSSLSMAQFVVCENRYVRHMYFLSLSLSGRECGCASRCLFRCRCMHRKSIYGTQQHFEWVFSSFSVQFSLRLYLLRLPDALLKAVER